MKSCFFAQCIPYEKIFVGLFYFDREQREKRRKEHNLAALLCPPA